MSDTLTMRASDHDRQQIVDLLRNAVEDGRLKLEEYMDRMELAYQAVTYGDLAPLVTDLPARTTKVAPPTVAAPGTGAPGTGAPGTGAPGTGAPGTGAPGTGAPVLGMTRAGLRDLPTILKVLWTLWFTAVSVNVVVWVLLTITSGHLRYPWPLWVAGPYGSVLFGLSAAVTFFRRNRRLPAEPAASIRTRR